MRQKQLGLKCLCVIERLWQEFGTAQACRADLTDGVGAGPLFQRPTRLFLKAATWEMMNTRALEIHQQAVVVIGHDHSMMGIAARENRGNKVFSQVIVHPWLAKAE